ncbi:MAG: cytochrome b N-terminal domain-containing protein [Chloroflexota bacterium]|nr:MAG: cytochrome B6 [Chloroflexota bacterium]
MTTTVRPSQPSPGAVPPRDEKLPPGFSKVLGIYSWLDERLGITGIWKATAGHAVPRSANWWYVFGSAVLTCFMIQVVTGVFLAFSYVPSTDHAYQSLQYITHQQLLGNILRGVHYWGASAMVMLIFIHMTAHFLTGSYKYPRELQWITGVFLLFLTLGMAFTGQLLRWNHDAYWAIVVGAEQAARAPIIGAFAAQLLTAGPHVNGRTLTTIYATHMLLLPGAIIGLVSVHIYLVIYKGVSEWPVPGHPVDPKTYWAEYQEILHTDGEPFFPVGIFRDAVMSMLVIIVIGTLAIVAGAAALGLPANPLAAESPKPDWYLVWYFGLLALIPPRSTDLVIILFPLIALIILLSIPLANKGERHYSRRPWAIATVLLAAFATTILMVQGYEEPWKPSFNPLTSSVPTLPAKYYAGLTPQQRQGAHLMHNFVCISCHTIGSVGGPRGPNLTYVGDRLTYAEMVTRITYGGLNMPPFGTKLTNTQLNDIVSYLLTRRDPHGGPASGSTGGP